MKMVKLGDLMVTRSQMLNPANHTAEEFELHSIPAFDRGEPEIALGRTIGSSKQIVQPQDVLLSRIVPHIRRAAVVPRASGRKQLASSEWIVFRHESFDPKYLVYFLTSDLFHKQFLNTVAGVGGSLLRARPQYVRSILAPLPPLDEQRRIAAILDKADVIRQKRRQAIDHLDDLTQSIFHNMFGDPDDWDSRWEGSTVGEITTKVTDGTHHTPKRQKDGYPLLSARNVRNGWIDFTETDFVGQEEYDRLKKRVDPRNGDILISCSGSIGRVAIVPLDVKFSMVRSVALVRPKGVVLSNFLATLLSTATLRRKMLKEAN